MTIRSAPKPEQDDLGNRRTPQEGERKGTAPSGALPFGGVELSVSAEAGGRRTSTPFVVSHMRTGILAVAAFAAASKLETVADGAGETRGKGEPVAMPSTG